MPSNPAIASRQGGAVGVIAALTLGLGLLFGVLVVDSGRLYYEQRQLQATADMAAIAAAQAASNLPGCSVTNFNLGVMQQAAQAVADRNGYQATVTATGNSVALGTLVPAGGQRQFDPGLGDEDQPHGVQVTLTRTVPASVFAGGLFPGETVTLSQTGVARLGRQQFAKLDLGSSLLTLGAGPLNQLLGLNLNLVSYQGLADVSLSLGDLLDASVTLGSVNELLNVDLGLAQLVDLVVTALDQRGLLTATLSTALGAIELAAPPGLSLRLGEVLRLAAGTDASMASGIDLAVLDLLTASAIKAGASHAINLGLNLGTANGPVDISAVANIISPPVPMFGPPGQDANGNWCTMAETAQVELEVIAYLAGVIDLRLTLGVAPGQAWLERVEFNPEDWSTEIGVGAVPGVLDLGLTSRDDHDCPANLLGGVVNIGLDLPVTAPEPTPLEFHVEAGDELPLMRTATAGATTLGNALASPDALDLSLLSGQCAAGGGGLLGGLLNPLIDGLLGGVLSPVLATVGGLLDPLLNALGIQLGVIDIFLNDFDTRNPDIKLVI